MTITAPVTVRQRTFPAKVRAKRAHEAVHIDEGSFEALVSAYGVEYPVGFGFTEQIEPGAFAAGVGKVVPVFFEHHWSDGPVGSGVVADSAGGAVVRGTLYVDTSERSRVVHRAMLDGALDRWSVAFYPLRIATETGKPLAERIVEADLIEASVVLRGANPDASTVDVRSRSGVRLPRKVPAERRRVTEELVRRYGDRPWFRELVADQLSGYRR